MPITGVGVTAVAVAAARALESTRSDALIHDPWAALLVRAADVSTPFPERWPDRLDEVSSVDHSMLLGAMYIGMRTRFIDDELRAAGLPQVAVLGSGLDTRSWRLDWSADTRVFELDTPEVVAFVEAAMTVAGVAVRCRRTAVPADVTKPWALTLVRAGFDPGTPAHWVLEGLLPYLTAHDQRQVLDDVLALSTPGSRAVIERAPALTDTPETRERLVAFSSATGIPLEDLLARTDPPDPATVLFDAGWDVEEVSVPDLELRYARRLVVDRGDAAASGDGSSRGGFVIARRPE
jgi:methyltransferase (TIGR00027 family)